MLVLIFQLSPHRSLQAKSQMFIGGKYTHGPLDLEHYQITYHKHRFMAGDPHNNSNTNNVLRYYFLN